MRGFPDAGQMARALDRARLGLDRPDGAGPDPEAASVFLQYLLLEGLAGYGDSPPADPRQALECLMDRLRPETLADNAMRPALLALLADRRHRARLVELALDAAASERLAPDIVIPTEPLAASSLAGRHRHAVIFAAATGFAHEFYALAVDAHARDAERHGETRLQLMGVHADWLDAGGAIHRVIRLDAGRNRLLETALDAPCYPDSAQFLCLGRREQAWHRQLATRLTCPQVNPWAPSALADDKTATLAGWAALELAVPRSLAVAPGDWSAARDFHRTTTATVVKPGRGTEGDGVAYLSRSEPDADARLRAALEICWRQGAAQLEERRDGAAYRDPDRGSLHSLALRLNVAGDGCRQRLSSGFAQIGRDLSQPASRGRGGRILPLAQALASLAARLEPGRPVHAPDASLWSDIAGQAERAASLFGGLRLAGLDVLLDLDARGRLVPVFLEANPRPAGLCQSRRVRGVPGFGDPLEIGPVLWDGLGVPASGALAATFPGRGGKRPPHW